MRLRTILFAVFSTAAIACSSSLFAHEYKLGSLVIDHPWSRATPPGAAVGSGYLTIQNTGKEDDTLVAASLDAAREATVHESIESGGVVSMPHLKNGLPIPAGATVELRPGGPHLMFMPLTRPLKEGESIPATLTFAKAGTVAVEFAVGPLGEADHQHPGG